MKNRINKFLLVIILILPAICRAQQINWKNLGNKTHIAGINVGWDYGAAAGIGYGQKLKTRLPLVLNLEYSSPFGNTVFDDFKTKLGGQAQVCQAGNFLVSLKAYGVFRRYQNDFVRLAGFGSEFSTDFGYYKSKWYVAGQCGFDKAITTEIKNSETMKAIYPGVRNGWYVPTGGNFSYGIVSGYTMSNSDVYIRLGRIVTQDFKTTPTVPLYLQLGFNTRF